ncbi:MAG: hypothetical protein ABR865_01675 [Terracidiphilus sp.]|jgi:hypothetical protein
MGTLRQFHTGLHTSDWHRYPLPPYRGRGWTVDFVEQKSEFSQGGEFSGDRLYPFKEVIVSARDQTAAQRAFDTISNSRNLLEASNLIGMLSTGPQVVSPVEDRTTSGADDDVSERPAFHSSPDIPLACLIAAKVSQRLRFVYALARLEISMETLSVPTIELDPMHSLNIPKSVFPEDQIRMATAIVSAYAAMEELGLTIRASKENPSRINGAWNPKVRNELEKRLIDAGVDLSAPFYWNLRGKRTRIEIKRSPEITQLARWAIKDVVRDGQMHISDAIAYASFLRSTIAAHSNDDKSYLRVLSVYDVSNVQLFARRLLLESVGYWRYLGTHENLVRLKGSRRRSRTKLGVILNQR